MAIKSLRGGKAPGSDQMGNKVVWLKQSTLHWAYYVCITVVELRERSLHIKVVQLILPWKEDNMSHQLLREGAGETCCPVSGQVY